MGKRMGMADEIDFELIQRFFRVQIKKFKHFHTEFELNSK
jgi:hypothetical protein